jgi:hypothetical protein
MKNLLQTSRVMEIRRKKIRLGETHGTRSEQARPDQGAEEVATQQEVATPPEEEEEETEEVDTKVQQEELAPSAKIKAILSKSVKLWLEDQLTIVGNTSKKTNFVLCVSEWIT